MSTRISPEEARIEGSERAPVAPDGGRVRAGSDLLNQRTPSYLQAERQALWRSLPELRVDRRAANETRLVTMTRSHSAHAAFDILRTNVLQELRRNAWTTIGVTSPTPGCGKTMVSLNLAFSLQHQEDCRTVLLDLDLRRPQLAKSLKINDAPVVAEFLRGQTDIRDVFRRHGENLAVGVNSTMVEYSAELLQNPDTGRILARTRQRLAPDVVIYDLPPVLVSDDVTAFLPNVDCVLIVAGAEMSTIDEVDICESRLSEKTNVLGVVLNKCRYLPERFGY